MTEDFETLKTATADLLTAISEADQDTATTTKNRIISALAKIKESYSKIYKTDLAKDIDIYGLVENLDQCEKVTTTTKAGDKIEYYILKRGVQGGNLIYYPRNGRKAIRYPNGQEIGYGL